MFQLLNLSEQKHRRISPSFSVNRSRLLPDQWKLRRKLECFEIRIRYINIPDDDYFYKSICSWNTHSNNLFNGGVPYDVRYSVAVEFVYSHDNFIWLSPSEAIHICRFTQAIPYHRSAIPPKPVPGEMLMREVHSVLSRCEKIHKSIFRHGYLVSKQGMTLLTRWITWEIYLSLYTCTRVAWHFSYHDDPPRGV